MNYDWKKTYFTIVAAFSIFHFYQMNAMRPFQTWFYNSSDKNRKHKFMFLVFFFLFFFYANTDIY